MEGLGIEKVSICMTMASATMTEEKKRRRTTGCLVGWARCPFSGRGPSFGYRLGTALPKRDFPCSPLFIRPIFEAPLTPPLLSESAFLFEEDRPFPT